jgi:hypothetical protein
MFSVLAGRRRGGGDGVRGDPAAGR